jgi:hypothetical protein
VVAALLVLAAACGSGPGAVRPAGPPPGATSTTTATATTATTGTTAPDAPRYPNLDRFTDPLDRYTYRSSFDRCAIAGAEGLSGDYGGSAEDPASVARAYARFVDPAHEEAAAAGCLDGLLQAGP